MRKTTTYAVFLSLACGPSACTKASGFLSAFQSGNGREAPAGQVASGPDPAPASKLGKEQVQDQLKGLVVTPGLSSDDAQAPPGGDFLVCDREKATADEAKLIGGALSVRYEASTEGCVRSWYKDQPFELTSVVGFASFTYKLQCPDQAVTAAIDVKSLKAAEFYRHQTFDFNGVEEAKCLAKTGRKAAYQLTTTKAQAVEGKDPADASKTSKLSSKTVFEVSSAEHGPCGVVQEPAGAVTVKDCVYRSSQRVEGSYSFRPADSFDAVTTATAHDLRAKPGDRFYSSGTLALTVNNWHGEATFKNGAEAPVAELSDGRQTVRFRLNGEFTNEVP
jgi:hypothetical protein